MIKRANLDGSNPQDVITGIGDWVMGLALDTTTIKIYCSSILDHQIKRADISGQNIETIVTAGERPAGLALDVAGGKVDRTAIRN